jgi:uncharacterized protein
MPKFEWDPAKARQNLAKHGVSFELAMRVWDDPLPVILPDLSEPEEERWYAVGAAAHLVILVVVHVYRSRDDEERVRIISARKATPRERKRYEQERL